MSKYKPKSFKQQSLEYLKIMGIYFVFVSIAFTGLVLVAKFQPPHVDTVAKTYMLLSVICIAITMPKVAKRIVLGEGEEHA